MLRDPRDLDAMGETKTVNTKDFDSVLSKEVSQTFRNILTVSVLTTQLHFLNLIAAALKSDSID